MILTGPSEGATHSCHQPIKYPSGGNITELLLRKILYYKQEGLGYTTHTTKCCLLGQEVLQIRMDQTKNLEITFADVSCFVKLKCSESLG